MPGKDDDDDEGFVAWCQKFSKTALLYGGSFMAVACAFVSFDVAERSAPMKDPRDWVKTFETNVWFGWYAYVNSLLHACAVVAIIRFLTEMTCILLHYSGVFKPLKYVCVINVMYIVFVSFPVALTAFSLGMKLSSVTTDMTIIKADTGIFKDFDEYHKLTPKLNREWDNKTEQEIALAMTKINWIHQEFRCCGMNGSAEWSATRPTSTKPHWEIGDRQFRHQIKKHGRRNSILAMRNVSASLAWWFGCSEPAAPVQPNPSRPTDRPVSHNASLDKQTSSAPTPKYCDVPYSCCEHGGACYPKVAYSSACKTVLLELLVRCLLCSCGLLLAAGLLGMVSAVSYYKEAMAGIIAQEKFQKWLLVTGQLKAHMEDD